MSKAPYTITWVGRIKEAGKMVG